MKSVSYCARERNVDRNTSSVYQYESGTRYASCNAFSCTCEPKLKGPTDMHNAVITRYIHTRNSWCYP